MFKPRETAALNREQPTYMEQLLRGEVLLEDIDNFVDLWHDSPDGSKIAYQRLRNISGARELWVMGMAFAGARPFWVIKGSGF